MKDMDLSLPPNQDPRMSVNSGIIGLYEDSEPSSYFPDSPPANPSSSADPNYPHSRSTAATTRGRPLPSPTPSLPPGAMLPDRRPSFNAQASRSPSTASLAGRPLPRTPSFNTASGPRPPLSAGSERSFKPRPPPPVPQRSPPVSPPVSAPAFPVPRPYNTGLDMAVNNQSASRTRFMSEDWGNNGERHNGDAEARNWRAAGLPQVRTQSFESNSLGRQDSGASTSTSARYPSLSSNATLSPNSSLTAATSLLRKSSNSSFTSGFEEKPISPEINPALLSHIAVFVKDNVPKDEHTRGAVPFPSSFTGSDVVSTVVRVLPSIYAADRRHALHVGRTLQENLFFFEVNYSGRILQDNLDDVYIFGEEEGVGVRRPLSEVQSSSVGQGTAVGLSSMIDTELPTGVLPDFSRCYSPSCSWGAPGSCYAYGCPNSPETKVMRVPWYCTCTVTEYVFRGGCNVRQVRLLRHQPM
jgi:hypothetical protein